MPLADPAATVVHPPSPPAPLPASADRGRSRDAARATLGLPRDAGLAGTPHRRMPAVERHAHQAGTTAGICNMDASFAQHPRGSRDPPLTARPRGRPHHHRPPAIATNDDDLAIIADYVSGSFQTSRPGSFLPSVEARHSPSPPPSHLPAAFTRRRLSGGYGCTGTRRVRGDDVGP